MIWLTHEQHQEVLEDPRTVAIDKAAMLLAEHAIARGTAEAVHAHARVMEAAYWLAQDLAHMVAQRDGRDNAASNGNGSGA